MASTVTRKRGRSPAKVSDMTPDELRAMIETSVERKLVELLGDPDEGLELRPEVVERIERQRKEYAAGRRGKSLQQVMKEYKVE